MGSEEAGYGRRYGRDMGSEEVGYGPRYGRDMGGDRERIWAVI